MDENGISWKQKQNPPQLKNILKMINECNNIKFAGYRAAAKLRVLQRVLHMDSVRLGVITGVFKRHCLQVTENAVLLNSNELEAVIFDIFFATQKENSTKIAVDLSTNLMVTFLQNIFDRNATGKVQVLSVKAALVVLSSAKLQEKYEYLFRQLADHNSCISANGLEKLLTSFAHIFVYFNESTAFGFEQIASTLDSCFQQAQGTLGITEDMFIGWMLNEPQMLIWLPTLHRMKVAENVSHSVKCSFCRMYPVIGLRYKCLECFRFNLCQTCFFTGRISKRHKLHHAMQEYCYEASSSDSTLSFLRMIKNKLCGSSYQLQHLCVQPHDESSETDRSEEETLLVASIESDPSVPAIIHESLEVESESELQSIISKLEQVNRFLLLTVNKHREEDGVAALYRQLGEYHMQVASQVERLKKLKLNVAKKSSQEKYHHPVHFQSTPLHRNSENLVLSNISPIFKEDGGHSSSSEDSQVAEGGNDNTLTQVSMKDLSTWVLDRMKGEAVAAHPSSLSMWMADSCHMQKLEELDTILEKLRHVLASNFSLASKEEAEGSGG